MPVDPISLEVYKHLFASVAEEMGLVLQRTAFSPNIRERLDFSCAVFDAQARMIAQAAHIPVHLGSMPASVEAAVRTLGELGQGDVVILNDPYHGGTHLPDVTMVSPVYAGEHVSFYVASRAHHADVGGMAPGSLPLSTSLYQEGIIIPPTRIVANGMLRVEVLDLITANSRSPDERTGDFEAQLAAHRAGEGRLATLIATRGLKTLKEHAQALQDYSQRITQQVIAGIPDGQYRFCDVLEGDGQTDQPLVIQVQVSVNGAQMHVDFEGTSAQTLGNVNAVPAIVRSATWYVVRLLADDAIPVNHGCFEPIDVRVPTHSLLNPDFPAAVAVGNTETSQRITDVVLGALAQALPDKIPAASQGTMNNITVGSTAGHQSFVYYETIAGGHGAGPSTDGVSGRHSHMTNTLNTPVEALEYVLPMRIVRYALRDESGGAGRYRGGMGVVREYAFEAAAHVTINSERRQQGPYGLADGGSGQPGTNHHLRAGLHMLLASKAALYVLPGDHIIIETPGGGGWGPVSSDKSHDT